MGKAWGRVDINPIRSPSLMLKMRAERAYVLRQNHAKRYEFVMGEWGVNP
jgi:hypothetical protein